jgi:Tfp pilus assembly protein PilO
MDAAEKPASTGAKLLARLHDPIQLRVVVVAALLLSWYGAAYLPKGGEIEQTTRDLARDRKRLALAKEIESLRAQVRRFRGRLPAKTDPNEWVQYVLGGLRQHPLKMVSLDPDEVKELGPYKIVVLRVEIEGWHRDIDAFLRWIEANPRLFRVDSARLVPHRSGDGRLLMQLTVLGVMG